MKKHFFSVVFALLALSLAGNAGAAALFNGSSQASGTRYRSLTGDDGTTTATMDMTFEIDFKHNSPTPHGHRMWNWVKVLGASPAEASGTQFSITDDGSEGLYVEFFTNADMDTMTDIPWNVILTHVAGATTPTVTVIGNNNTAFAYDMDWHRLRIEVSGMNAAVYIDEQLMVSGAMPTALPNRYFSLVNRVNSTPDASVNPRYDNIRVNNVIVEDNEGDTNVGDGGTWLVNNGSNVWAVDAAAESDYVAPAPAQTISFSDIIADDDRYVSNDDNNNNRDGNFGGESNWSRYFSNGTDTYRLRVSYIRWDLTTVDPNYIPGTFDEVVMQLGRRTSDGDGRFNIYGILETFDVDAPSSTSFNTGAGIDQAASPNINDAIVLDLSELTSPTLIELGAAGEVTTATSTVMTDFLNADTDGIVTFLIAPAGDFDISMNNQIGGAITSIEGGLDERESRAPYFGDYPALYGLVGVTSVNRARSWSVYE